MLIRRGLSAKTSGVLCAAIVIGILIAGLWPFSRPPNGVTWLPGQKGVHLGKRSTMPSSGALPDLRSNACSIEIWFRPDLSNYWGTLLAFYGPSGVQGLSLHQSLTDLRLDSFTHGTRREWFYIGHVFNAGRLVFLSVVHSPLGTEIYVNGMLAKQSHGLRSLAEPCSGSFVVGDSPTNNNTWQGQMLGLAIYNRELSAKQVACGYWSWRAYGSPLQCKDQQPQALYLFDEGTGSTVRDHAGSGVSLSIPARYTIAQHTLLVSPRSAFEPTFAYFEDIVVNIFGFVPFGFTLRSALSARSRGRRANVLTIGAGLILSLTIESLQVFLPTRDSDLTDVLTNTLGTCVGVALYRWWDRSRVETITAVMPAA